jgi:hypothetical protein
MSGLGLGRLYGLILHDASSRFSMGLTTVPEHTSNILEG